VERAFSLGFGTGGGGGNGEEELGIDGVVGDEIR
jgi:hypothetical protein